MLETLNVTRMAGAMAEHASRRMELVAKNVAQSATPGYKAMDLPEFSEVYDSSAPGGMRATRPGHFTSAGTVMTEVPRPSPGGASPNGNTVSLEEEMVKSVMVRKDHNMALAIYGNARDILRASLGRR